VVVLRLREHDAVDENAGDLHLPRVEAAALGDALDLRNHQTAAVVSGHGDRQHF
jgi:hypothetical protein